MNKGKTIRLEDIYRTISEKPGINRTDLARMMGVSRGSIEGRLASLEARELYISEDQYGRLYTHRTPTQEHRP